MTSPTIALSAPATAADVVGRSTHDRMLHTADDFTCPILADPTNYHFERRCEDCDAFRLSRLTLGEIEDRYHVGRITQEEFEAYTLAWGLLSPTADPTRVLIDTDSAVRRFARKLIRAKGLAEPIALAGGE